MTTGRFRSFIDLQLRRTPAKGGRTCPLVHHTQYNARWLIDIDIDIVQISDLALLLAAMDMWENPTSNIRGA
jgi:hypothetical protein